MLADIGRQNLEKHQQLDAEYADRIAENEADLAEARKAWQEAIDAARQKREAKDAQAGPEGLEDPDSIMARLNDAVAGLGDRLSKQAEKIGVKGTFNAAAVRGLGAGDAADRTAKATEETAKNTRKLLDEIIDGGLAFS